MKINKVLFTIIYIGLILIFFRDFFLVINYFLVHNNIPFYNIEIESGGFIIYLKDFSIILTNLIITFFLIKKNLKFGKVLIVYIFILLLNIVLSIHNLTILQILSDIRILNSLYFIIIFFYLIRYYIKKKHIFPIEKILKLYLFLALIDAIASLIEFSLIDMKFGFRIMGLFSVAALNAYVLFFAEVILLLLFLYNKISKINFIFLSSIYFFAILTTGTRVVIFGYILLISWGLFQLLLEKKSINKSFKHVVILFIPIIMITISIFAIDVANNTADRGDVLNQSDRGRVSKLITIFNTLENRNKLLLGEGSGWGSNVVSSLGVNIPSSYKSVDGSIQFLLIHNGVVGFILFVLANAIGIFRTQKYNKYNIPTLVIPLILIALSVNVLEQTIVLIAFGLSMSFTFQQEYIKRKLKQ